MIKNTTIIEQVISPDIQEELKFIMFETLFPWFYQKSLSQDCSDLFKHNYSSVPGFAHVFYNEYGAIGNFYDFVFPIIENSCQALGINFKELYYGRAFFQMPGKHASLSIPHIDIPDKEHLVLIYYVLNADGETVLFNRTHNMDDTIQDSTPLLENDILHKIKPQQGNVLAFNGSTYHANILPIEHERCIINFNLSI